MNKLFAVLVPMAGAIAGDISVFQKAGDKQFVEIRGSDTAGFHAGDFGTAALTGDKEEYQVGAFSNQLVAGLETVINIDALEDQELVDVMLIVDGTVISKRGVGNGVVFAGTVESSLAIIMIREDGSSSVRRIDVAKETMEMAKSGARAAQVATSGPLSIRFIVRRGSSSQFCEVVPNSGLGGRFVSAPSRTLLGYTTNCKTDRVSRGEQIVTLLTGTGMAESGIQTPLGTFTQMRALPTPDIKNVGTDARLDNLIAFVKQGIFNARLRVPIGSR